jgi:hypothetical protein
MWVQLWLAFFGLGALFCALGNHPFRRKLAPILGLCAEPFWFYFAYDTSAGGVMILSIAYGIVYGYGLKVQWFAGKR